MAITWNDLGLKDNPFASTPPRLVEGDVILWADMEEIKNKIRRQIDTSVATSPYSLVLNWGPWGGGKTHAAKYFSQPSVLEDIGDEQGKPAPLSVVINVPRGSKSVVKDIYTNIIGFIGIDNIASDLRDIREALGPHKFRNMARRYASDDDLSDSIVKLSGYHPNKTLFQEDTGVKNILRRYFNAETTKTDLKELGLGRNIDSTNDYMSLLATIINLLTYSDGSGLPLYSEFFIWLDEMEEIKSLPGKEQTVLSGMIRDLTDYVPRNITIFLNFSSAPGGEYEDLGAFLGGAVWDRVNEENEFERLTEAEMQIFVTDLIEDPNNRVTHTEDGYLNLITDDALHQIYEMISPSVFPRKINEVMSLVFEIYMMSVDTKDQPFSITADFVNAHEGKLRRITQRGRYQAT